MTTLAHTATRDLAQRWEDAYPSAVLSGIAGDKAHQKSGGYHISIEDQPTGNYSVTRPDDKAPPGKWPRNLAAAIDMSMSLADMKLCHARLLAVWKDHDDPRRAYLNAFNGWDGVGSPGRYDFYANTAGTSDDTHRWHTHLEIRRRWATDQGTAQRAIVSVLTGQTRAEYEGNTTTGGGVPSMATVDEILARLVEVEEGYVVPRNSLIYWVRAAVEGTTTGPGAGPGNKQLGVKLDALTAKVDALSTGTGQTPEALQALLLAVLDSPAGQAALAKAANTAEDS